MVNKDFFQALLDLEAEKGISAKIFIEALENALVFAYKKHTGDTAPIMVKLNEEKCTIRVFAVKNIVETVADPEKEISLEDAQKDKKSSKIGDVHMTEIAPKDFGRIAAQTAKQVVLQKLRETERVNTVTAYSEKEGQLLTGIIRRIDDKNIYVEMGSASGQIEGLLMPQDQVPGEKYELNSKIKVFVKKVRNLGRVAQIIVSRSSAMFVKKLFENEVPEIARGLVEIKSASREAGQRTKIAVWSSDKSIDAVGSCVGTKGIRVNAVVSEIAGEKIDIVQYSENPLEFIARALSPAPVLKVLELEQEKCAMAVVPDDKLSLAIGRDGQNVRLAARLTGWKIDVKSSTAYEQLANPQPEDETAAEQSAEQPAAESVEQPVAQEPAAASAEKNEG